MKEKKSHECKKGTMRNYYYTACTGCGADICACSGISTVADGQTLDLATGQLTWTEGGALIDTYTINEGDTINIAAGAACL